MQLENLAKKCTQAATTAEQSGKIEDERKLVDCCCDFIKECCGSGSTQNQKLVGKISGDSEQAFADCETALTKFVEKQQSEPRTASPTEFDPATIVQVVQLVTYLVNWFRSRKDQ